MKYYPADEIEFCDQICMIHLILNFYLNTK